MKHRIDDNMETRMWWSCAGYIERTGSILWVIGPMTGKDKELVNNLMMSMIMGSESRKGKMTKIARRAMLAMAAGEKSINPPTVSLCTLLYHCSSKRVF